MIFSGQIVKAPGMTYTPWSNGPALGFECEAADGRISYVYLNPSTYDDDGLPNVFVYNGTVGDPAFDGTEVYVVPVSFRE